MAVDDAFHGQNVLQNLSVGTLGNVNAKNWCTFDVLVVHRQNLKIVLPQFLRQLAFPAENFNTNGRTKCSAGRSILPRRSTGGFATFLQRVLLVTLDALMHTLHTSCHSLLDMG